MRSSARWQTSRKEGISFPHRLLGGGSLPKSSFFTIRQRGRYLAALEVIQTHLFFRPSRDLQGIVGMRDRPMVKFRPLKCKQSSSRGVRDDMWGRGRGRWTEGGRPFASSVTWLGTVAVRGGLRWSQRQDAMNHASYRRPRCKRGGWGRRQSRTSRLCPTECLH